jgi:colanic acid biosynthesis glycosyl transferase WcaI
MKRLIFLNRFFHPDQSATSQILSDLAFHLAMVGYEVHVVTSRSLYDNSEVELPPREVMQGAHIHRLRTMRFGRSKLVGRVLDYLSFYLLMWRHLLGFVQSGDVIVAKTDPPLLSIPANWAARLRGAQMVHWLQDIYPEIAVKLGVPFLKGPLGSALALTRDRSLKRADAIVVPSERMAARLRERRISQIHVVPNWVDDELIIPVAPAANALRREWNLDDKFVVGYSGNLGRAHEFETLLASAERLRSDSRIVFVVIGGGFQFDALSRLVRERNLGSQFRFLPYQNRDQLKYSLSVPDVHWVSLNPNVEGLMFPSKFYGIAAAGRPMIAVAAKDSEIVHLVRQHACGFAVEPGDSEAFVNAILTFADDPQHGKAMGERARAMLDAKFSRRLAFQRWRNILEGLSKPA